MLQTHSLSKQRLEALLDYLALVVNEYGEAYYPIFERFESELQIAEEREQKIKARLHSFK